MAGPSGVYFDGKSGRQDRENLLIVEGFDDCYFFDRVLSEFGVDPDFYGIVHVDGKDKLEVGLANLLKSPSFTQGYTKKCSVLVDSDDDPPKQWRWLRGVFSNIGVPINNLGEFVDFDGIQFGVMLIPGPSKAGDVDSVCCDLLSEDKIFEKVSNFSDPIIEERNLGGPWKRKMQIFLALQKEICRGSGRGFKANLVPFDKEKMSEIVAFIESHVE
jgi:hypothetical protein